MVRFYHGAIIAFAGLTAIMSLIFVAYVSIAILVLSAYHAKAPNLEITFDGVNYAKAPQKSR